MCYKTRSRTASESIQRNSAEEPIPVPKPPQPVPGLLSIRVLKLPFERSFHRATERISLPQGAIPTAGHNFLGTRMRITVASSLIATTETAFPQPLGNRTEFPILALIPTDFAGAPNHHRQLSSTITPTRRTNLRIRTECEVEKALSLQPRFTQNNVAQFRRPIGYQYQHRSSKSPLSDRCKMACDQHTLDCKHHIR